MKRVQHCAVRWGRPGEYGEYMVRCIWLRVFLCDQSAVALLDNGSDIDGCLVKTDDNPPVVHPRRISPRSCQYDLLRVVEMFLCESMIQGGALGAISFGKAGAMGCQILLLHERLQV